MGHATFTNGDRWEQARWISGVMRCETMHAESLKGPAKSMRFIRRSGRRRQPELVVEKLGRNRLSALSTQSRYSTAIAVLRVLTDDVRWPAVKAVSAVAELWGEKAPTALHNAARKAERDPGLEVLVRRGDSSRGDGASPSAEPKSARELQSRSRTPRL